MGAEIHVVTGAFGFTGRYIARRLLNKGYKIRTLTNTPSRFAPDDRDIAAFPLTFDDPEKLSEAFRGASVLYNSYWVRFNHRQFTFAAAVKNSRLLFEAAKKAGIRRIVHISITNPSEDSPFEYFRGKAVVERALKETGVAYAILRPAIIFGKEDILVNNIAWLIRRFPVFGVFGDGDYRLQPIYVDDIARLAVEHGSGLDNRTLDAVGPETFTYRGLVEAVCEAIQIRRPIISVSPALGYALGWVMGKALRDVIITRDEIAGLMAGLLYTGSPPTGTTKLTDWLRENALTLGTRYSHELRRRMH